MLAFLLGLLGPIGDFILKLLNGMGPSPLVKEAEKAGAAEAQVQVEEAKDVEQQKAADAQASVASAIATDDGLHAFEATDSNNRDAPRNGRKARLR